MTSPDDSVVEIRQLLIIAPQGRPPELKGRAALLRIEQSFADNLATEARSLGWQPIVVVDPDVGRTPEEKLAIHARESKTSRVIVLNLDTIKDASGMNFDMRAECVHLKFIRRAPDGRPGANVESVETHTYRLYNEHTGDSARSFGDMAVDLTHTLNQEKWF